MISVNLTVNGASVTKAVAPRTHLADFVREELNLTGTHIGCEHGVCGACTMIVDGRPMRSCINYAVACAGSDVRTVESFDDDPVMSELRDAFTRHHALQCGYCTPGMLATAYDIVTRLPDADEARVREELAGNLCRCTGYVGIVGAIRDVLAAGTHRNTLLKARPAAPVLEQSRPSALAPAAAPAPSSSSASAVSFAPVTDGVTLSRHIDVPVPAAALWRTLQDIETIARCLPGASLDKVSPDGTVTGAFQVAIGPINARFGGAARVAFDQQTHRGEVSGQGADPTSRSRADGTIRFAALAAGDDASQLSLDLTYRLGGPLVQFGRPAVVAGVVDALLVQFAHNLARASQGEQVVAAQPIGGGLLFAMLFGIVRRLFTRKAR